MTATDYGIARIDDVLAELGSNTNRVDLTERIGCVHTSVEVYRALREESIALPSEHERLCIPIGGSGRLVTEGELTVPAGGVSRIPAGIAANLTDSDAIGWVVIGAPAEPTPTTTPVHVDVGAAEFSEPSTSSILTARLTDPLGCDGMKVNARRLRPSDRVPYHTEGRQEELFIPITGDEPAMLIAGERIELSVGSIARVSPETPRSAMNPGKDDSTWVMVGTPPTGGPDEWDPGATILDWPD